jgi:phosphoglycerol transferase MdoB-like AlkP superfamily enzyme
VAHRTDASGAPFPRRWRAAAIAVSTFWLLSFVTRIALAAYQGRQGPMSGVSLLRAFGSGALLDLQAALWLTAPLVLFLALLPQRWLAKGWVRNLLALGLASAFGFALFVAVAEFFFFQEFDGRFNFVAVDYLLYPTEVVENIWQSYHTGLVLGGIALVSVLAFIVLRRLLRPADQPPRLRARRLAFAAAYAAALALAPFVLFLALLPQRWLVKGGMRNLLALGLAVAFGFALFVAVAEFFFFQEFDGRFNFVAVDYLLFPTEVVENIWQSYHTGFVLGGIALVSVLAFIFLRRLLRPAVQKPWLRSSRLPFVAAYAAALALATFGLPRGLSRVSSDRAVNEIADNGYRSFWQALAGQDAPYEGLYRTNSADADFRRLHRLLAERATDASSFTPGSTLRHIRALRPARRSNVVLVLEESLGSEFVGAFHPEMRESLTPSLDALIPQGTLLARAYSTGNRTIRALEATTASLPPLPGISIVRRERSRGLFTLPEVLRARGYRTLFVYGGRALFDGMGRYMKANGVERVVEQSDFPKGTFRTAWGVCDEAIFDRALAEMDAIHATGAPFYTIILTVTNHRPFLYPPGRIGPDPAEQRRVNAVRYADFALGRFIEDAHRHAFFDDTLFVLMGDHGPRVYGSAEIPMPSYEIPILLYGPKLVSAGVRVLTLASAMDVPPTVLGLLGVDYESKFFGRDVLQLDPSEGRALMTHNNEIALLQGSDLATLGLHRGAAIYRYDREKETLVRDRTPGAASNARVEDAVAYYDGADKLYRGGGYGFAGSADPRAASASAPDVRKPASSRTRPASRAVRADPASARTRGRCETGRGATLAVVRRATPVRRRLGGRRSGRLVRSATRIRHRRTPRRPGRTGGAVPASGEPGPPG